MRNAIPGEVDAAGFEVRLEACSGSLQELVSYLRTSSQHAGEAVVARRFNHPEPNFGWGVTYYTGSAPFSEIHPKPKEGHVWVHLYGVDADAVQATGFEPSVQRGWFKIRVMGEAVRFVHWILQAYDARSTAA